MNALEALARLRKLDVPALRTSDAAAAFAQSKTAATMTLSRLARAGLIMPVRQGLWWVEGPIDRYALAEYLTAPLQSYVSLHTALHIHGLVEQIPEVVYAVSLARTQRVRTRAGTVSIHHVAPEVFGGFEESPKGAKIASAEKALFDFAYLSAGRSRLFTSLPEVELPRGFDTKELRRWLERIPSERSRTITERKLDELLRRDASARGRRLSSHAKKLRSRS